MQSFLSHATSWTLILSLILGSCNSKEEQVIDWYSHGNTQVWEDHQYSRVFW
ncbi:MAG: hypothetical protein P8M19_03395 [Crocinitomicaceae bacterium]|nr:hypothetical protein [Crocinitomicaceae bacterium]